MEKAEARETGEIEQRRAVGCGLWRGRERDRERVEIERGSGGREDGGLGTARGESEERRGLRIELGLHPCE